MRFSGNLWAGLVLWFTLAGLGAQPLKFELLNRDLVVVRGSIGSLEGLRFLVDTGAMPSMVDRKLAKKLALEVQKSMLVAFGVKTEVQKTLLPNLRLGPLHVESVSAGVGDLSFLNGVDAIIGLDVLTRKSFSIDYEARLMTFGPVEAQEPSVLLEATAPFLTVQLGISGKPFRFLVDTGSSHLILFERRVRNRLPRFIVLGELRFIICRGLRGCSAYSYRLSMPADRALNISKDTCPASLLTDIQPGSTACLAFARSRRSAWISTLSGRDLLSISQSQRFGELQNGATRTALACCVRRLSGTNTSTLWRKTP